MGWMISFPLVYWFVLNWYMDFYKVLLCVVCLALTFMEAAFSICIGCKIYNYVTKTSPKYCPGGACETHIKDKTQQFNPLQASIAIITFSALLIGIYLFLGNTESRTHFGEYMRELVLTDAQIKAQEEAKYAEQMASEFGDDDF